MRRKQVAVIGSGDDVSHEKEACAIGRYIALKGWVLISGGGGGIMEAASRGAFEVGGTVLGILPGSRHEEANPFCTIVIPTGIGFARNLANVLSADAVISISGGSGTLSELAYAWQCGRPIIACVFTGGWSAGFAHAPSKIEGARLYRAESLEDVFRFLDALLGREE